MPTISVLKKRIYTSRQDFTNLNLTGTNYTKDNVAGQVRLSLPSGSWFDPAINVPYDINQDNTLSGSFCSATQKFYTIVKQPWRFLYYLKGHYDTGTYINTEILFKSLVLKRKSNESALSSSILSSVKTVTTIDDGTIFNYPTNWVFSYSTGFWTLTVTNWQKSIKMMITTPNSILLKISQLFLSFYGTSTLLVPIKIEYTDVASPNIYEDVWLSIENLWVSSTGSIGWMYNKNYITYKGIINIVGSTYLKFSTTSITAVRITIYPVLSTPTIVNPTNPTMYIHLPVMFSPTEGDGKLFPASGTYESKDIECPTGYKWTTMNWSIIYEAGTNVSVQVKTATTQVGLLSEPYQAIDNGDMILVNRKWLKFKITMTGDEFHTPYITWFAINYTHASQDKNDLYIFDIATQIWSKTSSPAGQIPQNDCYNYFAMLPNGNYGFAIGGNSENLKRYLVATDKWDSPTSGDGTFTCVHNRTTAGGTLLALDNTTLLYIYNQDFNKISIVKIDLILAVNWSYTSTEVANIYNEQLGQGGKAIINNNLIYIFLGKGSIDCYVFNPTDNTLIKNAINTEAPIYPLGYSNSQNVPGDSLFAIDDIWHGGSHLTTDTNDLIYYLGNYFDWSDISSRISKTWLAYSTRGNAFFMTQPEAPNKMICNPAFYNNGTFYIVDGGDGFSYGGSTTYKKMQWFYPPLLYNNGNFTTDKIDLGEIPTIWSKFNQESFVPPASNILTEGRSSADGITWSSYVAIPNNTIPTFPLNRYIQYKFTLTAG